MSIPASRSESFEFCFRIPTQWNLNSYQLGLIHVIGMDGTPWPCKVRVDRESPAAEKGPIVHIARNQSDSGHVYFLFPHPSRGDVLLSTGTLPIREAPYDLLKELARGTLNRLRNQLSIWQEGGLEPPIEVSDRLSLAIHCLAQAIMKEPAVEQDEIATDAINQGVDAIYELSRHFGEQISGYRVQHSELPHFWIGATIPNNPEAATLVADYCDYLRVFDSSFRIENPHESSSVSSASTIKDLPHPIILGPWVDASQGGLSESLLACGNHLDRRRALLAELRSRLEAFGDQVHLLHLMSGINGIGHRHLSYPQQFQLATDMLQLVDEALLEVPVMVSFDFPWAERLASAVGGIHPLQTADSLLRQGVQISYFGLEVNLDYWPGGSAIRDPFQWIDLVDTWAQLEIPLVILLRTPIGGQPVPADQPVDRLVNQPRSCVTDQQRLEYLELILPMLVARPTVHGVIWSQWKDDSDSRFPHGGLADASGKLKSVCGILKNLKNSIAMG